MSFRPIRAALLSVYHKDRLAPLVAVLRQRGVTLYSTGGTQKILEEQGAVVTPVEALTGYPEVFGGRVKTLHPKVFGGILHRRHEAADLAEAAQHDIPPIDLVVVDLYPFEETVASGAAEAEVIEKIDIGGIALLRAAAKNYRDVLVVSSRDQYAAVTELLQIKNGATDLEDRRQYAATAFATTSHYDTEIWKYVAASRDEESGMKDEEVVNTPETANSSFDLRYGENPHQTATFHGDLTALFDQLHGKQLSYNNLVDVDAAVALMREFADGPPACAILKHTNACGVAQAPTLHDAYANALACDPVSAFGGVIVVNREVDEATAEELNKLFFEVLIAPGFAPAALPLLQSKKNRILLAQKPVEFPTRHIKNLTQWPNRAGCRFGYRNRRRLPHGHRIGPDRRRSGSPWNLPTKSANTPRATPSCWPAPANFLPRAWAKPRGWMPCAKLSKKRAASASTCTGRCWPPMPFSPFPTAWKSPGRRASGPWCNPAVLSRMPTALRLVTNSAWQWC